MSDEKQKHIPFKERLAHRRETNQPIDMASFWLGVLITMVVGGVIVLAYLFASAVTDGGWVFG